MKKTKIQKSKKIDALFKKATGWDNVMSVFLDADWSWYGGDLNDDIRLINRGISKGKPVFVITDYWEVYFVIGTEKEIKDKITVFIKEREQEDIENEIIRKSRIEKEKIKRIKELEKELKTLKGK